MLNNECLSRFQILLGGRIKIRINDQDSESAFKACVYEDSGLFLGSAFNGRVNI
jgi:hypothetical protein